MIKHSVSGQNQRQYVCLCARVRYYIQTNVRTSLRTYRNKRKCVSLYTHMYIYIHTYVYIHTRISSHRVCVFCCSVAVFSSFFLNNNNAKSYSLSQRLSLVGEGIGGEEGDRISWKELERYANICRVNVNDELSMLWTCTYIHTHVYTYVFMHTYIHIRTAVFSCVAYTSHSLRTVCTFACWLQLSQAQHHKRRMAEKQNRNEIVYAFALK